MNRERALDLLEWLGKEAKKILGEDEQGSFDSEVFRQKIGGKLNHALKNKLYNIL